MQSLPSVMSHQFSRVPQALIQRSSFDRSCGLKTAFNAGQLIPIFVDLAVPGDTFSLDGTVLARISSTALTRPIMDNLFLETFWLACPVRMVWSNFQKFMGEQTNPGDSISYTIPQMPTPVTGVVTGSLSDHLGIPYFTAVKNINSLWHRMYNKSWNQLFRDQNMQTSVTEDVGDGPDTYNNYGVLYRGKRHDYFTSCLTAPQKGTALSIPTGTTALVKTGSAENFIGAQVGMKFRDSAGNTAWGTDKALSGNTPYQYSSASNLTATGNPLYPSNLYADLSTSTAVTINAFRQTVALQQFLERDMRGGTRYTEIIRSHFGVISPDARLQRVEFLGSGMTPININPVAGTNQSGSTTTAPGQLSAFGTAAGDGHGFTKSFTEHTLIMGLACVRADLTYQQGVSRFFTDRTRYDWYWPGLANLGEQAVLQGEIFADGTANDDIVFGYQERYAQYRYKPSEIHGIFRSNCSAGVTSIENWHLSQDFATAPTLNTDFIQETPPMSRVLAVTTEPHILADFYFKLHCARPMPLYGVPGLTRL